MPKKYKNLVKEKRRSLFTAQQRKNIDDVEAYIDDEIELQWETGSVRVDGKKAIFLIDVNDNPLSYTYNQRDIMIKDLNERFLEVDWILTAIFENPNDMKSPIKFLELTPK